MSVLEKFPLAFMHKDGRKTKICLTPQRFNNLFCCSIFITRKEAFHKFVILLIKM